MVEVFSVQDGLCAERALLDEVCSGARDYGLLLWQPGDHALVMSRRMERLEHFAAGCAVVAACGWPVLLRNTGGEPVPQSPDVLNIALSYALGTGDNERTCIETAYLRLCRPICNWLERRGLDVGIGSVPGSFCDGRYNIILAGRKLAGTAQRWQRSGARRSAVLVHAALLVGTERVEMVEVVNTFVRCCDSGPDCRADRHLGLSECWSDFQMADSIELERCFFDTYW